MLYSHTDPQYVPYLKPSQDEDSYFNASFIDVRKKLHVLSMYWELCFHRGTSITEPT